MRWMRSFLFRVTREPAYAAIFVITLALAALDATAIPALRARRLDLVSLLRPQ